MKIWGMCGVAIALAAVACGSSSDDEAKGSGGTGGAGGTSGAGGSGGGSTCPADPLSAVGQSCSVAGLTCGTCADPCVGCDIASCVGAVWKKTAIPPDTSACADGGQKNWCSIESMVLCKSNEFCGFSDVCGVTKTGYCTAKPTTCTEDCPKVCGCDGKTYCNECKANQDGVSVDPTSSKCADADGGSDAGGDAASDGASDAATDAAADSSTD